MPEGHISANHSTPDQLVGWLVTQIVEDEAAAAAAAAAASGSDGGGKSKKAKKPPLKQLLVNRGSGVAQYGADIIHHVILHAGLKPSMKVSGAE